MAATGALRARVRLWVSCSCTGVVRHMVAVLDLAISAPVRACLSDTAGEEAIPSRRGHAGKPGRNAGRAMQGKSTLLRFAAMRGDRMG